MKFTKMQGIGNDYIYVDGSREQVKDPAALSRRISDRHFGIGSDGLVMILPGDQGDFRMRMFNADGSEAEMCGNASRCVAKYVYERGLTRKTDLILETGAGLKGLHLNVTGGHVESVRVDMGAPELNPERIPADRGLLGLSAGADRVIGAPLQVADRIFPVTCVSTGNPHCVIFQEEVDRFPLEIWGPQVENHPAFPRRVNTEFARILDRQHIRMRVWERGSGETLACGTGACATLTAAVLNGLTDRKAVLQLNGGNLEIEWDEKTGHLMMTGPAEFVFDGEID
ncbi:MAG: diaminopimelate epimerase [Clostridia bacterium]|nr:diaminopimelate epimerase [Clostridia bacterium]